MAAALRWGRVPALPEATPPGRSQGLSAAAASHMQSMQEAAAGRAEALGQSGRRPAESRPGPEEKLLKKTLEP